jgi:hypothetical protein
MKNAYEQNMPGMVRYQQGGPMPVSSKIINVS